MPRSFRIVDSFSKHAEALREVFDSRFEDPRSTRGDRFVWDYWHVPGQYTALRTPAWEYFPRQLYRAFHSTLVNWGRSVLGCHDISPTWLSCYVDGCRQELHGDLPHGPWAFVYSLTPWQQRAFTGGETVIVKDEVLEWWKNFRSERSIEEGDLLHSIPPRFNRLLVFDPRLPHGVRRVGGTHDPREGRLVIHGWFVQPRPFIIGPVKTDSLTELLPTLMGPIQKHSSAGLEIAGFVSLGFTVTAAGRVSRTEVLSETTRTIAGTETQRRALVKDIVKLVGDWRFPKQRGPSRITLPLVFEV